jgi:aminoglycoside phosphotransferase (APT) family kinase protein
MDTPRIAPLSRYYDVLLSALDREVRSELNSDRAKFLYGAARRILARLATVNEHTPALPENLATLHPEGREAVPHGTDAAAFRAALLHEGRLLDAIEDGVRHRLSGAAASSAATAAATPITAATLEAYIRERLDPTLRLRDFRILAGGRSKQTIMLTLTNEQGEIVERVIRRDLIVAITGGTVIEEYQVLKALADRGYPVPRPFLLEVDTGVLGSAFMVMQRVSGSLCGDVFDPPASREAVLHSARVLGRLHSLPVSEIAPTIRESLRVPPNPMQLREQVLALQQQWQSNSRAYSVTMQAVFRWMLENLDSVTPQVTVVHGDYSYHNLLFDGELLSSVMDWELVKIGHPADDVGYIRAAALQRVEWSEFMTAYKAGGGCDLTPLDVSFYTLLGKLRLMSLLFGARAYFESGATDDLQLADVSIYHLPRMIQQLSFEIRLALGLS